jgi:hypothetical protein
MLLLTYDDSTQKQYFISHEMARGLSRQQATTKFYSPMLGLARCYLLRRS